jgi:hypothetical protein
MALIMITTSVKAQHVEVDGKLKVTDMDTINAENLIVVKQADGTLAARQLSSLPPPSPDTMRTLATDLDLAKLLCDCSNHMPPFLIESTLASGYTAADLFYAGVTLDDLAAGGGLSPLDVFNSGVPINDLFGEVYQGGVLFFLDSLDIYPFEGLVAADVEQGAVEWGCYGAAILGADGTAIGAGYQNTLDIDAGCIQMFIASEYCLGLNLNGYNDWFLPSIGELEAMFTNLGVAGYAGFSSLFYWSSSERDADTAWGSFASVFVQDYYLKNVDTTYRPIRDF